MTTKASSSAAWNASRGASLLSQLYDLVATEADQPDQLKALNDAIDALEKWLKMERAEIGTEADMDQSSGMAYPMSKALGELKAEPLDAGQLDKWLDGQIPRRILMVPFGGPLPGGKSGLDLDREYFDADTDLFGPFPSLRHSRERLVDWHHDQDPTGRMKGAILGRVEFDEHPEDDGVWADFWANAGEKRRSLVAALERKGVPLYGSTEAVAGAIRKAEDGHIEVWPVIRHTITTSPQNSRALVPPLKALLTSGLPHEALTTDAVSAAMFGVSDLSNLRQTSLVGDAGADGRAELERAIQEEAARLVRALHQRIAQNA